jgi:hypothetical protein
LLYCFGQWATNKGAVQEKKNQLFEDLTLSWHFAEGIFIILAPD